MYFFFQIFTRIGIKYFLMLQLIILNNIVSVVPSNPKKVVDMTFCNYTNSYTDYVRHKWYDEFVVYTRDTPPDKICFSNTDVEVKINIDLLIFYLENYIYKGNRFPLQCIDDLLLGVYKYTLIGKYSYIKSHNQYTINILSGVFWQNM